METLFTAVSLGGAVVPNRFVFPPVKLASGQPDGKVTDRQTAFYRRIARDGPGLLILEPVAVTPEGREHPKQLCVHLPESAAELRKLVDVVHDEGRLACLHLNHAGAAANPMATQCRPKAPSEVTCFSSGQEAEALDEEGIEAVVVGFGAAARKALEAGFDCVEVQAGHGYLVSQFLNGKLNRRSDVYGQDRVLFARRVLSAVREGAPGMPLLVRISGSEMSPEFGISHEDVLPFLEAAKEAGACALHVGMGSACFSPPWYFHHGSLPEKPQTDALGWVRAHSPLPLIAAGRMGRRERVEGILAEGLADLIALGRPLIADPDLLKKWRNGDDKAVMPCGYCLQGCLHRVKNGQPLGCNLNPEIGMPALTRAHSQGKVLVAGGGPAGMSAALYLARRGHSVTLAEQGTRLGGQFALAWQAPGKEKMRDGLASLEASLKASGADVLLGKSVDASLIKELQPDLLVWATGASQNIPEIPGLEKEYVLTSFEYFRGGKPVRGPRVLVIGAGRTGIEIAEKLGRDGYEVAATKRTDPIGSMMEMVTRNLALKRIGELEKVVLMPHTTVKGFMDERVDIEQDGAGMSLEPFQTVILASGTRSAPAPDQAIRRMVPRVEVIGDAAEVRDIFSAVHAGYELARAYEK